MKLLILFAIIICSIILCKVIGLSVVLLFIMFKNTKLKKDSNKWNQWFSTLNDKKLTIYISIWYLISIFITSLITYGILLALNFKYAFIITIIFLIIRSAISVYRFKNNKDVLIDRFKTLSSK